MIMINGPSAALHNTSAAARATHGQLPCCCGLVRRCAASVHLQAAAIAGKVVLMIRKGTDQDDDGGQGRRLDSQQARAARLCELQLRAVKISPGARSD